MNQSDPAQAACIKALDRGHARVVLHYFYIRFHQFGASWPGVDMQALYDPMEEMQELARKSGRKGCAFCGGLGHRIADCPKLASQTREKARSKKDFFGSGGFGGEV